MLYQVPSLRHREFCIDTFPLHEVAVQLRADLRDFSCIIPIFRDSSRKLNVSTFLLTDFSFWRLLCFEKFSGMFLEVQLRKLRPYRYLLLFIITNG
jgi:hypothetical protein